MVWKDDCEIAYKFFYFFFGIFIFMIFKHFWARRLLFDAKNDVDTNEIGIRLVCGADDY